MRYYVIKDKTTNLYYCGNNKWSKYFNQIAIYKLKITAETIIKTEFRNDAKVVLVRIDITEKEL